MCMIPPALNVFKDVHCCYNDEVIIAYGIQLSHTAHLRSFMHSFSKHFSCFPCSRGIDLSFSLLFRFQMVRTLGAENMLMFVSSQVLPFTKEKLLYLWSSWPLPE